MGDLPVPYPPENELEKSMLTSMVTQGVEALKSAKKVALNEKDVKPHHHRTAEGVKYECKDPSCPYQWWNHPDVKAVFTGYMEFRPWVGTNINRFNALVLLQIKENQGILTGPLVEVMGRKFRVKMILQLGLALFTSTTASAFIVRILFGG